MLLWKSNWIHCSYLEYWNMTIQLKHDVWCDPDYIHKGTTSRKSKQKRLWNLDRTSEICNSNLLPWILSWRLSIPKPCKVLWMPKPSKAQMQHFQPLGESGKFSRFDFSPAGSNVGSREGGLCHQFVEMFFFWFFVWAVRTFTSASDLA